MEINIRMETISMKTLSIKRLVLALILGLGSFITLPAYAWPDTDEMNMCGASVKNVRSYANDHLGWAAHDNYVAQLGQNFYYRNNCPESKATKYYKGKNWAPGAKMHTKTKAHKKMHKKHAHKHMNHHKKHHGHNTKHKNHADCLRTDRLNNMCSIVKKANRRVHNREHNKIDHDFYRQAQAVLNMSKVHRVSKIHNLKHKNHADCVRTDGLNNSGSIVRVVRKKHH